MRKRIILTVIILIILFFVVRSAARIFNFIPFLFELTFNHDIKVKTESQRLNILLLGVGGGSHDGASLTDTIIVASISPKNDKITLISLPRDFWVPELSTTDKKINTAYQSGEVKRKGGGIVLAQAVVKKITNLPIDYTVRIDFSGFVKAVDLLGGIDVNVENSFDDYEYPIDGKETDPCNHKQEELEALATVSSQLEAFPCRYEHIHFNKGFVHMDGVTALKFVRSRHANGSEGSDFARSKRQEKVIKAFKDKAFSLQMFLNPGKFLDLFDVLSGSIDTNIRQDEYDDFVRLAQKIKTAELKSVAIDTGDTGAKREGLLINPQTGEEYNFEWVLIPRTGNGNYAEIKSYINCELTKVSCPISKASN
jgi:polyisoprenyl-teichoic acid--peptidoglycan teichoic acid transferase